MSSKLTYEDKQLYFYEFARGNFEVVIYPYSNQNKGQLCLCSDRLKKAIAKEIEKELELMFKQKKEN